MKIQMDLSSRSIQKAIEKLETYRKGLIDKNEIFVRRLADAGIPVIDKSIASAKGTSNKSHYTHVEIRSYQGYSKATLIVEGQDLLFIEFGAGVHYNTPAGTSPHPKGEEYGYTIGSYGKGYGANDGWWYTDSTGASIYSQGTQATMPVYNASKEIIKQVRQIAKEVFG